jgi:hypothetical protein
MWRGPFSFARAQRSAEGSIAVQASVLLRFLAWMIRWDINRYPELSPESRHEL